MKRITPNRVYAGLPCSVVAVGCAMGAEDARTVHRLLDEALSGEHGAKLKSDGYLSLDGLNGLIRAHSLVIKRENFRRGERPALRDFAHSHLAGVPWYVFWDIICILTAGIITRFCGMVGILWYRCGILIDVNIFGIIIEWTYSIYHQVN